MLFVHYFRTTGLRNRVVISILKASFSRNAPARFAPLKVASYEPDDPKTSKTSTSDDDTNYERCRDDPKEKTWRSKLGEFVERHRLPGLFVTIGLTIGGWLVSHSEHQQEIKKKEGSKKHITETFKQQVKHHLNTYTPPLPPAFAPYFLDLPYLERPDYETVKREVESSDIVIFVGPSNCGKSTTVRRVIAGRKGTVFISLRELDDNVGYVFAKKFGCDVHLYSEFNAPQGLIRELIKDALQELKQENGPSVVVVLDDVHIAIDREHKLFKSVDFKNVMIWLLEMHSEGLLTFKMLTSERNIISTLRQLPGFAGRLTVHEMDYVPTDTIANYLRSNFKGITQHDADCVTRTIGGHLGDLRKVIYALALHEPNPMCNTVQEAISALIKSDTIIMRDVLKGVIAPPSYSKKTFTRAVHQIFQSLTENEHHKVSRSDVRRKVGISVEEMDKIVEFLEDLHLIVDIDGVKVTFHAPRQVQAYLMLKDEIDVQEALSEALQ